MKTTIEKLSKLSKEKHILWFIYDNLLIKVLPPFISANGINYENCIYINGTSISNNDFVFDIKSLYKDTKFVNCWNALIKNQKIKEDILWKYFIYYEPWDKYIHKHSVRYEDSEGLQHKDIIYEINKNRVRLNLIHKIPMVKEENTLKGIKIFNVTRLVA